MRFAAHSADPPVYQKDTLRVTRFVTIAQDTAYDLMIHRMWRERLRQVVGQIQDPDRRTQQRFRTLPV